MHDQRTQILAALRDRVTVLRAKDPSARSIMVQLAAGEVEFELPVLDVQRKRPVVDAPPPEAQPAQRAVGDDPMDGPDEPTEDVPLPDVRLRGIASSTSVDWYGTEMSRACLDSMAAQFRTGVDLLPRHHGFLASVEWDEVMGRTDAATLLSGPVADPASPTEPGFRLEIEAGCPGKQPKVRDLVARIDAGQKVGLSIGGWFRAVQYVWAEDADPAWDDPERIIVHEVELEHLAVVRSPANPDATALQVLRSLAGARSRPVATEAPTLTTDTPTPEVRATPQASEYVTNDSDPTPSPAEPEQRSENMDTEQILAAINGLGATITSLSARIEQVEQRGAAAAPAPTPTPAPAPTDDRVAKLEAEIVRMKADRARQENVIADLASGARAITVDNEIHLDDEDGRKAALRARIARAKESNTTPTVATLAERHIDVLATNPQDVPGSCGVPSEGGERARRSRAALPNLLRSICNAADRDGFFNYNANELRGWAS